MLCRFINMKIVNLSISFNKLKKHAEFNTSYQFWNHIAVVGIHLQDIRKCQAQANKFSHY